MGCNIQIGRSGCIDPCRRFADHFTDVYIRHKRQTHDSIRVVLWLSQLPDRWRIQKLSSRRILIPYPMCLSEPNESSQLRDHGS